MAAVLASSSFMMLSAAPAMHHRAPPPHALLRAPQPRAAVADSRYRKSTGLYERLEEGQSEAPQAAPITRPVLLAPAGGWPQVEAAIKGGADAIYFGCAAGLNARARATNFGEDELPALMARLHEAGLEGYMCVNVLIYEKEMAQAEQLARTAEAAGVDGLIVQDVGLASRLHAVAPSLPLHASTQMSISDADGARFAAHGLGARTVVLTRELSISDIAAVTAAVPGTNVEVFVHGHMCVSYNGQCFSSEAWGGRSANRGQCAQQCRMPYGLLVDGELKEVKDSSHYLLSPQDLCGVEHVPRLLAQPQPQPEAQAQAQAQAPTLTLTRCRGCSRRACARSRSRGGSSRPSTSTCRRSPTAAPSTRRGRRPTY